MLFGRRDILSHGIIMAELVIMMKQLIQKRVLMDRMLIPRIRSVKDMCLSDGAGIKMVM